MLWQDKPAQHDGFALANTLALQAGTIGAVLAKVGPVINIGNALEARRRPSSLRWRERGGFNFDGAPLSCMSYV